jgi:hypothetical protein
MSTKPIDTLHFKKMGRPNFYFYAVGSGISDEPILIKTNKCETKHEIERGNTKKIIPTSLQLEKILETLDNLPQEVKIEKETIESLKNELIKKNMEIEWLLAKIQYLESNSLISENQIKINKITNNLEIKQDDYLDYIKIRNDFIKIAIDLYRVEKEQTLRSRVKPRKKPTISQWHARGSSKVAEWLLNKYPELKKIALNPKLYDVLNTKIYNT